jgi:hypothetical protein
LLNPGIGELRSKNGELVQGTKEPEPTPFVSQGPAQGHGRKAAKNPWVLYPHIPEKLTIASRHHWLLP